MATAKHDSTVWNSHFGLKEIYRAFRLRISITWGLVLAENTFMTLVPLLMGFAIDGLLAGRIKELVWLGGLLAVLTIFAVLRRIYDTRAYGTIRVSLGAELDNRHQEFPVSARNARLDMSRELVDFLEEQMPDIIAAVVQITVALIILASFQLWLAGAAVAMLVTMGLVYSLFHNRFYRLNGLYNSQVERQVSVLEMRNPIKLLQHLSRLRDHEVKLSDAEAIVYGLIFLLMITFVLFNLWVCAAIPNITAGKIFAIISYSWDFAEAAIVLPITLQSWSRLDEITARINNFSLTGTKPGNES